MSLSHQSKPLQRTLYLVLCKHGPCTLAQLAQALDQPQSVLLPPLRGLIHREWVREQRRGGEVWYAANFKPPGVWNDE